MHFIVLDGRDPRSATFLFTYTLEWRTHNITSPAFQARDLDWSTPGFLRIEPEAPAPLPEGALLPPPAMWIPIDLVQAMFVVPANQQMPMPPQRSAKVH